MHNDKKITVVLPAYNAVQTLEQTVKDLPRPLVDEIILVDDASRDGTADLARRLDLVVFEHPANRGYGGNQKTCYREALARGADIIVMVHPDYQYDPKLVKHLAAFIADDYFDVMLGTRIHSRRETLAGGMPRYKYLFNRLLTLGENLASGYNLSEWHTGLRAYKRAVLESIPWEKNSDDFVFDSQMLFQIAARHYRIGEISVPTRYFPAASAINLRRSLKYGLGTVAAALKYLFGAYR